MLVHLHRKKSGATCRHTLACMMLLGGLAGLLALYGRTVATFLRVFVQVFFEEWRAEPPRTKRRS